MGSSAHARRTKLLVNEHQVTRHWYAVTKFICCLVNVLTVGGSTVLATRHCSPHVTRLRVGYYVVCWKWESYVLPTRVTAECHVGIICGRWRDIGSHVSHDSCASLNYVSLCCVYRFMPCFYQGLTDYRRNDVTDWSVVSYGSSWLVNMTHDKTF
jgi:hypothetical protein